MEIIDDPAMERNKESRFIALILPFLLVLDPCSPVFELLDVRICSSIAHFDDLESSRP